MTKDYSEQFSLHYIFDDKTQHEINATTLLRAELAFLDYINRFSKESGIKVTTIYQAREEGSFESIFKLTIENPAIIALTSMVFKSLLDKFASPNPKPKLSDEDSTEKTLTNYLRLKDKLHDGTLTKDEVISFIDNDKKLKVHKTAFWQSLKSDKQIQKMETKNESKVLSLVDRKDFDSRIVTSIKENETIKDAKVFITSPVLSQKSNEMWSGEYENNIIKFYVRDKEFKQKVFSGEISFKGATVFIECDLKKIKQFEDGEEIKPKYQVEVVNGVGTDPNHIVQIEHKKKKMKEDPNQMSLFSLNDN